MNFLVFTLELFSYQYAAKIAYKLQFSGIIILIVRNCSKCALYCRVFIKQYF